MKARRIMSGISSTRLIVAFHLTRLSKMLDGTSCWYSLPRLLRAICPISRSTGMLSANAPAIPVRVLVAPGPLPVMATPTWPVARA